MIDAAQHLPLARSVAWEAIRRNPSLDIEEVMSSAMFGLVQAALSFEPERGLAFTTHALPRIRGSILDDIRSATPGWSRRLRTAPKFVSLDADSSLSTRATTGEARMDCERLLGWLPFQEYLVVSLYHMEGMKMRQIAEQMGVTESRVSQVRTGALKRLRKIVR